jgi:hypothetical protein
LAVRLAAHAGIEEDQAPASLVMNAFEPNPVATQIAGHSSGRIVIPWNHEDGQADGEQKLLEPEIGLGVSALSQIPGRDDQVGIGAASLMENSFQGGE